jgi:FkbM family methyltransferase
MIIHTLTNGKKVALIENDSHVCKWIIQEDRLDHDQNCLPLLNEFVHRGFTVVDVGAFCGDHTEYYAKRVGSRGSVYAFEPNPKAFECLEYNMKGKENVVCFKRGVSDKRHTIGLAHDINAGATHAIAEGDIQCVALDEINLPECDFIKMDCEGMEVKALKGASLTIKKFAPTMLIEVNESALERQGESRASLLALLDSMGYEYRNLYKNESIEGAQVDIICTAI